MTIKLYVSNSDPKCVDKVLVNELEVSGTARDPLDMVNPVIEVEGDIVSSIGQFNYMIIEDYARSYFITSITGDSYHLSTIHAHCDILSSSKAWLRARTATITKNENLYSAYLNDPDFDSYAYKNIVTKTFPYGINSDSIILMTVGGGGV